MPTVDMAPGHTYTLDGIRRAAVLAASRDTAYPPLADRWEPGTLKEHCGAVAYVVQRLLGGVTLSGQVEGERWIFNRLPDGTEVSLCDGPRPLRAMRCHLIDSRFERFYQRVLAYLHTEETTL